MRQKPGVFNGSFLMNTDGRISGQRKQGRHHVDEFISLLNS